MQGSDPVGAIECLVHLACHGAVAPPFANGKRAAGASSPSWTSVPPDSTSAGVVAGWAAWVAHRFLRAKWVGSNPLLPHGHRSIVLCAYVARIPVLSEISRRHRKGVGYT